MVRILLALDDELAQGLAQTNAIADIVAATDSAEVHVLHVFGDNPEGASVHQIEAVREASDRLDELGVDVPGDEILRYAEEYDVDQICVGGRKRSPTGKALFGSVTQDVILGTHRPVLVCGSAANGE